MQLSKLLLSIFSLAFAISITSTQVFAGGTAQTQKSAPSVAPKATNGSPTQTNKQGTGTQIELNNRTINDPAGNGTGIVRKGNPEGGNEAYDPANDPIVCNKNSSSPESTTDCNK